MGRDIIDIIKRGFLPAALSIFTASEAVDNWYAQCGLRCRKVSVRLSPRLSITTQYFIKTTSRILGIILHPIAPSVVFYETNIFANNKTYISQKF